jgi:NAD(P)H dehydrogenase (quinone)
MSIVITGATGHLGRLVVESLLERGTEPGEIIATGRALSRVADLAERGVLTRVADYDDPDTLREAFAGAERVLLVSGTEMGRRVAQHGNVIDAAKEAGVGLIAYTSISNADSTDILLARDHQATEQLLRASGVPFAFLRHTLYLEANTDPVPAYVEHGAVLGSADGGRLSAATRADLAEGDAVVMLTDDLAGNIYELAADQGFTFGELASTVSDLTGRPVVYRDLPLAEYRQMLVGMGLPEDLSEVVADSHRGIAKGDLHVTTPDLSRLIGRPTTTMADAVAATAEAAGLTAARNQS